MSDVGAIFDVSTQSDVTKRVHDEDNARKMNV